MIKITKNGYIVPGLQWHYFSYMKAKDKYLTTDGYAELSEEDVALLNLCFKVTKSKSFFLWGSYAESEKDYIYYSLK